MKQKLPALRIGDLVAPVPIIQGGMGVGISMSGLSSAVSNEGAIGVISSVGLGMLEPDFQQNFREANMRGLRKEIQRARAKSTGILGINIMAALTDAEDLVRISVEEEADLILIGAGLPLKRPGALTEEVIRNSSTRFVPIISSARAARVIISTWERRYCCSPDAFVVEGPKAGGHLGFREEQINDPVFSLECLIPEILDVVKSAEDRFGKNIPVIAAGGIFSGNDIHKFLELGAQGVQMATRFVTTEECDAAPEFKKAYIDCRKEDLEIIKSPVGLPGRAIVNSFLRDVSRGINKPVNCPWKCLRTCDFRTCPYCIARALTNAKQGCLEDGFAFAGANAYRLTEIVSVKDLIQTLINEYHDALSTDPIYRSGPVIEDLDASGLASADM